MKYAVTIDGVTRDVEIQANPDGGYLVALDDEEPRPWSGVKLEPAEWILRSGHASHAVGAYLEKDQVRLQIDGHSVLAKWWTGGPWLLQEAHPTRTRGRFRLRSRAQSCVYLLKPVSV